MFWTILRFCHVRTRYGLAVGVITGEVGGGGGGEVEDGVVRGGEGGVNLNDEWY